MRRRKLSKARRRLALKWRRPDWTKGRHTKSLSNGRQPIVTSQPPNCPLVYFAWHISPSVRRSCPSGSVDIPYVKRRSHLAKGGYVHDPPTTHDIPSWV